MTVKPHSFATVSVVIPSYNRAHELRRALDSLSEQTDPDFDVIVCDDGSHEDLATVVDSFRDSLSIRYIRIENSGGPARPRNVGVAASQAEWISFLDSDDWWWPARMSTVKSMLSSKVDVVYHRLERVAALHGDVGIGAKTGTMVGEAMRSPNPLTAMIKHGNPLATSGTTVRRNALVDLGGFDESRSLSSVEDFDLWMRLAQAGCRFKYIPDVLGAYWLGADQISTFGPIQYERYSTLFERRLATLDGRSLSLATGRYSYLLGRFAMRLGMPEARRHLHSVAWSAGPLIWSKSRIKLLQLWCRTGQ